MDVAAAEGRDMTLSELFIYIIVFFCGTFVYLAVEFALKLYRVRIENKRTKLKLDLEQRAYLMFTRKNGPL